MSAFHDLIKAKVIAPVTLPAIHGTPSAHEIAQMVIEQLEPMLKPMTDRFDQVMNSLQIFL